MCIAHGKVLVAVEASVRPHSIVLPVGVSAVVLFRHAEREVEEDLGDARRRIDPVLRLLLRCCRSVVCADGWVTELSQELQVLFRLVRLAKAKRVLFAHDQCILARPTVVVRVSADPQTDRVHLVCGLVGPYAIGARGVVDRNRTGQRIRRHCVMSAVEDLRGFKNHLHDVLVAEGHDGLCGRDRKKEQVHN